MKVVINACFGGFSLSDKAEDAYAMKKGFKVFRYSQEGFKGKYHRATGDEFCSSTFTKDHGDSFDVWPDDGSYWYSSDIERDDPILVKIVEKLGVDAGGSCASLKVIEIPDGTDWAISEYDGNEHVEERHDTWF